MTREIVAAPGNGDCACATIPVTGSLTAALLASATRLGCFHYGRSRMPDGSLRRDVASGDGAPGTVVPGVAHLRGSQPNHLLPSSATSGNSGLSRAYAHTPTYPHATHRTPQDVASDVTESHLLASVGVSAGGAA